MTGFMNKVSRILFFDAGEVSEWLIEPVSKTGVFLTEHRGFESRPLRHYFDGINGRKSRDEIPVD